MAIQITSPQESLPAIVYDHIFMMSMNISQTLQIDDTKPPMYELRLEYRLYAVDDNQRRHFAPKVDTIIIGDYYGQAMIKAQTGNMTLVQAMGAIQNAVGDVVVDQRPEFGEAVIV